MPRTPLSRDRVLDAALAVADESGVAGVSMRSVAQQLGVEAMSLYHHVTNKDDLLDGMVDAVFGQVEAPAVDEPWREALRRRTASVRAVLVRHPWALGLLEARENPGTATLRHHDAVLGCLATAGFPLPVAGLAFALLDAYAYGFVLQEVTLPATDGEGLQEVAEGIDLAAMAEQLPHLAAFVAGHVAQPGYAFGDVFDEGLELLLDGLERRLG